MAITPYLYSCESITSNTITFSASSTTVSSPIFLVTGKIVLVQLWGVVTTEISSNHTGGFFRTETTAGAGGALITTSTGGTTLSSAAVNSVLFCTNQSTIARAVTPAAGSFYEITTTVNETAVAIPQPSDAPYYIVWRHTTTNAPESGAMYFTLLYQPIEGGTVAAV